MRKIALCLVGALASAGLLVAAPAPAAASSTCWPHTSYDEEEMTISAHNREVHAWTQLDFFHCRNDQNGNRWIEPRMAHYGWKVTNYEGQQVTIPCGDAQGGWLQNLKFDLYLSDRAGNSIDPGQVGLPCVNGGMNASVYYFDRVNNPRLLNCGGAPKWVNDIQVSLRYRTDRHMTIAGTMWGFTGPFPVHPNCP